MSGAPQFPHDSALNLQNQKNSNRTIKLQTSEAQFIDIKDENTKPLETQNSILHLPNLHLPDIINNITIKKNTNETTSKTG